MKRHNEDGSLLLVMLMTIAVGGMIVVLFSLVTTSQETTRRDRAWTESIQIADAGLQQAYSYLSTAVPPVTTISSTAAPGDADYATTFDNASGNGAYEWTAEFNGADWLIRSVGSVNGTTRIVEARFTKGTVGGFAMFSDAEVVLKGSNGVRSYSRTDGTIPCLIDPTPPCSEKGFVGTNDSITLNGSAEIDFGFIYGGGDCSGCGVNKSRIPDEFDIAGYALALEAEADLACPTGGTQSWSSTANGAFTAGTTYCLTALTFNGSIYNAGNDSTNPTLVYVFGDVDTTNVSGGKPNKKVNCYELPTTLPTHSGCDGLNAGDTPDINQDPGGLRIKVIGARTVQLQQQWVYTMTVDAPESACPDPGGQMTIYGYLICGSLGTNGGYDIAYNEDLNSSGTGDYRIVGYREELVNTTSFN